MQTVSLSFYRFATPLSRLWALTMMGAARLSLPRIKGLQFWKLCGSGTGEGFTPVPNTAVYAILTVWSDDARAREAIATEPLFQSYRNRASENWTLFLTPYSARGAWSGQSPFLEESPVEHGPIAALTRATVRPAVAAQFWKRVPDISGVIGQDPNVLFKIGIGEVPLLQQITFSIWPDSQSMANFARINGPHAKAIRAVRDGKWFREELYARFRVTGETGSWEGQSPRILKDIAA
ncbi:spheroidene monooxygenase [Marivita sp. S6314]|uniref:spheroidene monooxygenase n=1 Tax=Marivita sp. S6314 TaxID=2926406 RepID=UPI001FF20E4A|nr:spheroidene monooxygenase [Marivita sp. S6314]MCK0151285.1 spheroidene monooxygenase [Marivita sp. S6314]